MIAHSVTIGRDLLGLSDLALPTSTYDFGEFFTDGVRWNRITATGPWTDGRVLRAVTRDILTVTGELYVVSALSASPATHDAARQVLVDALSQFAWTLTLTGTDGASQDWSWNCEPADIEPDESIMQDSKWRWSTLKVTIPANPIALAGSY